MELYDSCRDADGDTLNFVVNSGDGIINHHTYTFTASSSDTGTHVISIIASDKQLSDTLLLKISVKSTDTKPPVITLKSLTGNELRVFTANGRIGLSITDPSGIGSASYFLNNVVSPLSIDSAGNCYVDYVQLKSGINKFVVTASDNSASKNLDSLVVNLRYNVLPEITLKGPQNGADALAKTVTFEWSGTDNENDTLTYALMVGASAANLEQVYKGKLTTYKFLCENRLEYFWKVKVYDSPDTCTESSLRKFKTNTAPAISLKQPVNSALNVSVPCNFAWEGSDNDQSDAGKLDYILLLDTLPNPAVKVTATPAMSYSVNQLVFGKRYYWRMIATDGKDSIYSTIYDFTTGIPAKILTQPSTDTLNLPGGNTVFTVSANGFGNHLKYQWLENGTIRQGDTTASLSLQSGIHNRSFVCVVSNGIGTADTSIPAQLKVAYLVKTKNTGNGNGTITPADPYVMQGSDQVFTIAANGRSVIAKLFTGMNKIDVNTVCTLKNVIAPDSVRVMFFGVPELMKPIPSKNAEFMMKKLTYDNLFEGEHAVKFTSDLYIDSTELTQKDYTYYMRLSPWNEFENVAKGDEFPAVAISFSSAILYCNAKSKAMGLDTIYTYTGLTGSGMNYDPLILTGLETDYSRIGFRLPTEAEWEFAYRAGNYTNDFYWGRNLDVNCVDSQVMNLYAWSQYNLQKNVEGTIINAAKKVATKLSNLYGLYDMAGNVWEYTNDWVADSIIYKTKVTNPTGNKVPQSWKVIKGGAYHNSCRDLCVHHSGSYEQWGAVELGFRTVLQKETLLSVNKID